MIYISDMRFGKIIVINILVIFALFAIFEFITFKENVKNVAEFNSKFDFLYPYKTNLKKDFPKYYKRIEYNEIKEIESGFRPAFPTDIIGGGVVRLLFLVALLPMELG